MNTLRRSTRAQISLARLLSKFGHASRAEAATVIAGGNVMVNGVVVRSPGCWIDPRRDRVTVDGRPLRPRAFVYLAMHKPAGLVTTRSDERGRPTVYDLLPEGTPWVSPVGRLDKETSGLLLFTNDTRFGQRITSPDSGIAKTYIARIDRPLEASHRNKMEEGVEAKDGTRSLPVRVVPDRNGMLCEVTIREGKNRQVRKMFERFGYDVVTLHRTRIGSLTLGELGQGKVRPLRSSELEGLGMHIGGKGP